MKFRPFLIVATLLAVCSAARPDPITDRLDALERDVAAIKAAVLPPATQPTTPPATQPTTQPAPVPVRADTAVTFRAAIAMGAKWIQTTGLELSTDIDAKGALIELLPGGPSWKPAVSLSGDATLANATIKTPPSTYNANGQRTGFYKALTATGRVMTLRSVTFAPDTGFCVHAFSGTLNLQDVSATTFSEYFVFQETGSRVTGSRVTVHGGSRAESVWRVAGGTYLIEDSTIDNSGGGKAALRGDSPALPDGSPGGVVRRTKFVGQVGPNPLTEDDGGQMTGIDRWRVDGGWLYQLDASRKPEAIAFARLQFLAGKTPADVVRACADRFIDGVQFAKVAKGRTRLSDNEIRLTLELRAKEVTRHSTFLFEDCEIVGDVRLNARATGTIRRTKITGNPPFSGNSQQTYPYPVDRVIVTGEAQPAPQVLFDQVEINGGTSVGIDLKAWPTLKFLSSTYKGQAIAQPANDQ